ncbi:MULTISPECIES: outer membrane lipoprotein-sorting protein [unclassified Agarivorans]|uniref:outer membrane lipoprotein-sorting protein n=1 Tax=unclassified Agarivorans TaxID=2636026 RepID=UPI003D7DD6E8
MIKSILLLLMISSLAFGQEPTGLDIATEMVNRDSGYQSYTATVEMTITAANGDAVQRQLTVQGKEQADEGDKIITYFKAPRDIAGTSLLTFSHAIEADDQWLYLPSIKRVKRISSNNRSGPFMGSEFAYEDMSSWELDKYRYQLVGEKVQGEHRYWLLACYPQYVNSGYSKLIAWIDQSIYQPRKIEYFDRKGTPLKKLSLREYKQYEDRYWRPHIAFMENLISKRTTELTWQDYRLGLTLPESQFDPRQLQRAYRHN